jgi:hypothetical protein
VRSLSFVVERKATVLPAKVRHEEFIRKVEARAEEPLGHLIFREAWDQRNLSPRSALVIGVTAAEVGLKKLIGSLVEETQPGSLHKILRGVLPTLPVKAKRTDDGPIMPPSELIEQVEEAVKYRNKVVHEGAAPPKGQDLINMLQAIGDLLWICDIYQGDFWAIEHVSYETQKNWQAKSE